MARRAGSDDGAVDAPPPAGHNLTEDVFLAACRQQAALNAERKALNEKINAARKTMKANGIELGIMDATLKMAEWERAEVRGFFDKGRQYAAWLNLPIGTQSDLFKGMSDDAVQRAEWHAMGRTAALSGKPRVAPDACPEDYLRAWDAGFDGKSLADVGYAGDPGSGKAAKPPKAPKAPKAPKGEPTPKGKKAKGMLEEPPAVHGKGEAGLKVVGGKDAPPPSDGWEEDPPREAKPH